MTQIETDVARSTLRKNKAVVDSIENVDWERRRYEIARDASPMCMYTMRHMLSQGLSIPDASGKTFYQAVATQSVRYADALIAELKGGAS